MTPNTKTTTEASTTTGETSKEVSQKQSTKHTSDLKKPAKATKGVKPNHARGNPVVKFDSKTGNLEFRHVQGREGLTPFTATDLVIKMDGLPEKYRQLIIKIAKVASCHASGQTISSKTTERTSDGKTTETIMGAIERLLAKAKEERKLAVESKPSTSTDAELWTDRTQYQLTNKGTFG